MLDAEYAAALQSMQARPVKPPYIAPLAASNFVQAASPTHVWEVPIMSAKPRGLICPMRIWTPEQLATFEE